MRFQRVCCLLLLFAIHATECLAVESQSARPPGLDPISVDCINCHNGTNGSRAGFCLLTGAKSDGHVISLAYAEFARANPGLRPMDDLPPEVVLHDGVITCVTCHGSDPHGGAALVIDNSGSTLCIACHLK